MAGSKLTMRAFPAFLLFGFFIAITGGELFGQRRLSGASPLDTVGEEPSQKLGWEILQKFRALWQPSGYRYHFELKIMPRREKSRYIRGVMIGKTNERGVAMRFDVTLKSENAGETGELVPALAHRFLLQSGLGAYAMESRSDEEQAPQRMDAEELFDSISESDFTVFDMLAPYVYWQRFVYEGRMTQRSRPVHIFEMYPPDDDVDLGEKVSSVRLFIDNQFNGLIKSEVYGPNKDLIKTLSLSEFRKVDGHWIFGAVEMRDEKTRNKTRFKVTDAAVGLSWSDDLFAPQSLMSNLSAERIYPENTAFIEKLSAE